MTRALLACVLVAALAAPAAAHLHVPVGDAYELTVGWTNEPPYVGIPNGLDLKVGRVLEAEDGHEHDAGHEHGDEAVVLGAEQNLTVTYSYGGKTFSPVDFRAAFGRPGWYTADITPTRPGVYTVHVTGDVEGTPVDVTVEPHEVEDLDDTSFPEKDAAGYETAAKLAALEARVSKLEADVQAQIDDPRDPVETPNETPLAGLLAVLALAGAAAFARRR